MGLNSGFLNCNTKDALGQIIHYLKGHLVHCGLFWYGPSQGRQQSPSCNNQKYLQTLPKQPWWEKLPLVENHCPQYTQKIDISSFKATHPSNKSQLHHLRAKSFSPFKLQSLHVNNGASKTHFHSSWMTKWKNVHEMLNIVPGMWQILNR